MHGRRAGEEVPTRAAGDRAMSPRRRSRQSSDFSGRPNAMTCGRLVRCSLSRCRNNAGSRLVPPLCRPHRAEGYESDDSPDRRATAMSSKSLQHNGFRLSVGSGGGTRTLNFRINSPAPLNPSRPVCLAAQRFLPSAHRGMRSCAPAVPLQEERSKLASRSHDEVVRALDRSRRTDSCHDLRRSTPGIGPR